MKRAAGLDWEFARNRVIIGVQEAVLSCVVDGQMVYKLVL